MCKALLANSIKAHAKLSNKLTDRNPIIQRIEAETGYRPHGPFNHAAQALGIKTGRRSNLYYRPGAKGNPEG